ncbi:MAG: glycosyltransferase family 2 protein [Candidatus Fermentibacteraceae bacterium]
MDDNGAPRVTVVVPAYNEARSLPELLAETGEALEGIPWEAVVVDDGSTDSTWNVLLDLKGEYPLTALRLGRNQGKAAALAAGFSRARGRYVATLDADLQDDPAEIPAMIELMEEQGLDLVSGWKRKRHDPVTKTLPSKLFNLTVRLTTGIRLHDFNCGLKVYRRAAAKSLRLYGEMHRYTPVIAAQLGFRVGEKPVHHRPRRYGSTKYGMARFFRGYADLITVLFLHRYSLRPLHFFGGIGTVLFLAGFVISLYLTVVWFGGEPIGNRPLLLLGILLLIVGFQFISLGLLGEMLLKLSSRKTFHIREELEE